MPSLHDDNEMEKKQTENFPRCQHCYCRRQVCQPHCRSILEAATGTVLPDLKADLKKTLIDQYHASTKAMFEALGATTLAVDDGSMIPMAEPTRAPGSAGGEDAADHKRRTWPCR
ncbi:MAG: hypothetical protein EOS34_28315 [Mesorhizobium sp.]|nr:MAG: hypothetical protein EOS34_28315 [Mesorhizobium sp.]